MRDPPLPPNCLGHVMPAHPFSNFDLLPVLGLLEAGGLLLRRPLGHDGGGGYRVFGNGAGKGLEEGPRLRAERRLLRRIVRLHRRDDSAECAALVRTMRTIHPRQNALSHPTDAAMPRPNFLIIGAMKAGTTSLWKYLHGHDQVYLTPPIKELHYFDREPGHGGGAKWSGPIRDDATYDAFFEDAAPGHKALGEAAPTYCFVPIALRRIHEYRPDMKLVMILRDPVTRAISHIGQRAWKDG